MALNSTKAGMKSLNINLKLGHDLLCVSDLTLHGLQLFLLNVVAFTFSGNHTSKVSTNDMQFFSDYIHPPFQAAKWISTWIAGVHVERITLQMERRGAKGGDRKPYKEPKRAGGAKRTFKCEERRQGKQQKVQSAAREACIFTKASEVGEVWQVFWLQGHGVVADHTHSAHRT